MKHAFALAFLLLLAAAPAPKPLAGYSELVVEAVVVEKTCTLSPAEGEYLQKSIVGRLRAHKLASVIDAMSPEGAAAAKLPIAAEVHRLLVTATVLEFSRGSRAARALGMGAGATRLRVRFAFKDPASGKEVFLIERIGRYTGRFTGDGGTSETAFSASVLEVADALVEFIEKNR